jgi:putative ABC transport system permease protein
MNRLKRLSRSLLPLLAIAGVGAVWIGQPVLMIAFGVLLLGWLLLTQGGRQSLAIAWIGLATVPERLGATSVVVVGIAGVVGVLVALQAMAAGFEATLAAAGRDDTVLVLRAGANAELSSALDRPAATLIAQAPGIARDTRDVPIASAEIIVVASVPKRATGTDANLEVRGVGPAVWALRPQVRILSGRRFTPGRRELIVGEGALRQFSGLEIGSRLNLNNQDWRIVGVFASGDTHASEVWGDAESLMAAYRRNGFQSVAARLTAPTTIAPLRAALAADPRLRVDVETTRAYYSKQSERLTKVIRSIGTGVAVIMALGAVFGALNTMYAAVANRAREIATLRALGFTGVPVVVAVMLETMTLALAGGALGACIAWGVFNGFTVSTLGSNFSQVVFQFQVTPELMLRGLQWALGIGFVGGLFPALRAATLAVTVALRES